MTDIYIPPHPSFDVDIIESDTDAESLASIESIPQSNRPVIEKILADVSDSSGDPFWYLVKWQQSPLLNSSWETDSFFKDHPGVLDEWLREKQRIKEGQSKAFNITAFHSLLRELEAAQRGKRQIRRFKRQVGKALDNFLTT